MEWLQWQGRSSSWTVLGFLNRFEFLDLDCMTDYSIWPNCNKLRLTLDTPCCIFDRVQKAQSGEVHAELFLIFWARGVRHFEFGRYDWLYRTWPDCDKLYLTLNTPYCIFDRINQEKFTLDCFGFFEPVRFFGFGLNDWLYRPWPDCNKLRLTLNTPCCIFGRIQKA